MKFARLTVEITRDPHSRYLAARVVQCGQRGSDLLENLHLHRIDSAIAHIQGILASQADAIKLEILAEPDTPTPYTSARRYEIEKECNQ